jgi:hypothetical protein
MITYSPKHRFRDVLYSMADALVKAPYPRNSSLMQIIELIGFILPFLEKKTTKKLVAKVSS